MSDDADDTAIVGLLEMMKTTTVSFLNFFIISQVLLFMCSRTKGAQHSPAVFPLSSVSAHIYIF